VKGNITREAVAFIIRKKKQVLEKNMIIPETSMLEWSHCQVQPHQCAQGMRVHSEPKLGLHSIVNKEAAQG
jgi:hypothetical protein